MLEFKQWLEQVVSREQLSSLIGRIAFLLHGKADIGRSSAYVFTQNQKITFGFTDVYLNKFPGLFITFSRLDNTHPAFTGSSLQTGTKQLLDDFNKVLEFLSSYDIVIEFSAIGGAAGDTTRPSRLMRRSNIYAELLRRHGYVRADVDFRTGHERYIPARLMSQIEAPKQAKEQRPPDDGLDFRLNYVPN